MASSASLATAGGTWLSRWEPENDSFWRSGGSGLAWRTLTITTLNLTMAFIVWFLVSALVVRLPQIGFRFTPGELFWLAAMPGLAGGTLRLVHMFLTPMYGTRLVVSLSTLSLLVPLLGWFYAVQNPATPYWVLMLLAFLAGLGGGNFSSFMPSTSLFFPKRLQGTALAIQAGIGNFGVSIVQFVTPWIIGFALFGGAAFMGAPQTLTKGGVQSQVYLQNAAAVWIPFVLVFGVCAWLMLKSVPVKANFAQQFDIFRSGHTWSMTSVRGGTDLRRARRDRGAGQGGQREHQERLHGAILGRVADPFMNQAVESDMVPRPQSAAASARSCCSRARPR